MVFFGRRAKRLRQLLQTQIARLGWTIVPITVVPGLVTGLRSGDNIVSPRARGEFFLEGNASPHDLWVANV